MAATRSPSAAGLERELRSLARQSKAAHARAAAIDEERDRVIRAAIEAKIPRARIAELADLSEARVFQIRRAGL